MNRASSGPSRSAKPQNRSTPSRQASSTRKSSSNRQTASTRQAKPTTRPSNKSINGGHQKSTNRKVTTPNNASKSVTNKASNRDVSRDGNRTANRDVSRDGNRGSGDRVNIDKSRGDVNINVDKSKDIRINNQRNTHVRSSNMIYSRPPYRYGGFGYYCHRPYFYHPYRPFYWGPVWHPWGWFVATLATTAIIVSIENQKYHYDQGVYYVESNGGYTVVQAPVGATVEAIPKEAEVVKVNETTNNYYYGGAYYEKSEMGYTVVPATAGTIVPHLPEGGEEVKIGDVTYVQFGETYYQPIQVDGKDMYEIVEVREE